ncbi:MAG: hypothetical protein AAGJ19_08615 [Myxococcota bacterium]
MRLTFIAALPLALAVPSTSTAQPQSGPDAVCRAPDPELEPSRRLRALSLDLTGVTPGEADYQRLADGESLESLVDEMLASQDFIQRVVRSHRALLLNNVDNVGLTNFRTSFTRDRATEIYWRRGAAQTYRGQQVRCLDEPARFGPEGEILTTTEAEARREGWVMVSPYWDPQSSIKVCAFDAQTAEVSPRGNACGSSDGLRDAGCGCGENLNRCRYGSNIIINRSFAEDVNRRVAAVIEQGLPYSALFTSRTAFVNGPILHFYRHQAGLSAGVSLLPLSVDLERMPDIPFTEADTWVEVNLPEHHAGVLTSPAFLLRFQTNRARASRFYDTFLCQPFSAPDGGLPVVDPDVLPEPDLQKRDGCAYCHALLEPAASHWGRWTEQGAGFLDPEAFPSYREECRECGLTGRGCSRTCRSFYVDRATLPAEEPFLGYLDVFMFLRDQHLGNVDLGPAHLVESSIVDDRFPICTARRLMESLFGRSLFPEENERIDDLTLDFVASDLDYKALVKAVVLSDVYGRLH